MNFQGAGAQTYLGLTILSLVLMGLGGVFYPDVTVGANTGLCLDSPNLWIASPIWSRIANAALLTGCSFWMWLLNKRYNFVRNSDYTLPALFIILVSTNPLAGSFLSASSLLLVFWLICFSILFGCFDRRNSTQQVFLIATFLSLGAMADYAFLTAIPMVIVAAILLKAMRFREFVAFLMGLIAPWWIGYGFGWIDVCALHWPQMGKFADGVLLPSVQLSVALGMGILAILASVAALNTAVKLYAGHPQPRVANYAVYATGLYTALCIVLDSGHAEAYLASFYFPVAVVLANFLCLNKVPKTAMWVWIIGLLATANWVLGFIA